MMSNFTGGGSVSGRSEGDSHMTPLKGDGGAPITGSSVASVAENNDASSVGSSWAPGYDNRQQQQSQYSSPSRGGFSDMNSPARPRRRMQQQQQQQQQQQAKSQRRASTEDHPLSIQDRVVQAASATGSTALYSTLEILKILGSTTLNTTGKLVAPPLQVTKQVILPALWSSVKDYISYLSPQRLKDWFRIVSSSLHHFITVVKDTPKGIVFRRRLFTLGHDVVDSVSCDASRQVIIDGMATVVKFSEAMHTPECKALLEQLSVLGCRLMDAAAVGRNKQLLHDFNQAVWAGLEMASDPSTILALAEVTACLCHALEMEETIHRNRKPKNGTAAAARRRYERNQFQRQTYADMELTQDPDSTVEEVILSSLGGAGVTNPMNGPTNGGAGYYYSGSNTGRVETDHESLPSNVMLGPQDTASSVPPPPGMGDAVSTDQDNKHNNNQDTEDETYEEQWKRVSADVVDVDFLQQQISLRAANMERKHMLRTTIAAPTMTNIATIPRPLDDSGEEIEDLVVETVSDDENDAINVGLQRQTTLQHSNKKLVSTVDVVYGDDDNRIEEAEDELDDNNVNDDRDIPILNTQAQPPIQTIETMEPATSRFYRTLDDLLAKKRSEAINEVLAASSSGGSGGSGLRFHSKAAAAAGAGNEDGMETLKSRMQRLIFSSSSPDVPLSSTSMIGVGGRRRSSLQRKSQPQAPEQQAWIVPSRKPTRLQLVLVAAALVIMFVWFLLGCYGLWMILYPGVSRVTGSLFGIPFLSDIRAWLSQPRTVPAAAVGNEIVIRVVKEVIHKTADGSIVSGMEHALIGNDRSYNGGGGDDSSVVVDTAKVAECVADAIK